MRTFDLKNIAAAAVFGLVGILATGQTATAQSSRETQKQERKVAKQQEKVAKQEAKLARMRQNEWTRRNGRIAAENARMMRGNARVTTLVVANGDRYRVYRGGRYYNTDNRGAEMLRSAVNEGYRQGFAAGRSGRDNRRNSGWANSSVYRAGNYGYSSHVDRGQYQYYFRQGFQRGYQDGSNSRFDDDHNGQFDYGYRENGSLNILGTVLNQVLNLRSY